MNADLTGSVRLNRPQRRDPELPGAVLFVEMKSPVLKRRRESSFIELDPTINAVDMKDIGRMNPTRCRDRIAIFHGSPDRSTVTALGGMARGYDERVAWGSPTITLVFKGGN